MITFVICALVLVAAMTILGPLFLGKWVEKNREKIAANLTAEPVYWLKASVLTQSELRFLRVLEQIETPGLRLIYKVRLADIFDTKSGQGFYAAFNRISAKHVDFLLIRESDGKPMLGIELDDSSHEAKKRQERDDFVDRVFNASGLPLLHFPVQKVYDPQEMAERMMSAIGIAPEPSQA